MWIMLGNVDKVFSNFLAFEGPISSQKQKKNISKEMLKFCSSFFLQNVDKSGGGLPAIIFNIL